MTIEMPLTKGKIALIDDEDYALILLFHWFYDSHQYARTKKLSGGSMSMHRLLIKPQTGYEIDHIDGNRINNQRKNLRIVTHKQNQANQGKHIRKTSQYKGVCWRKDVNKWIAYIETNNKPTHLGYHLSEVEAARAYDRAALDMFGEYARLNVPLLGE